MTEWKRILFNCNCGWINIHVSQKTPTWRCCVVMNLINVEWTDV